MRVFVSYSHEDEGHFKRLCVELKTARRILRQIDVWGDSQLKAGDHWDRAIRDNLATARVVILLVSPDFMASDYIWEKELTAALAREERGECVVVPVIIRPTALWTQSPFAKFQALPKGGKAITLWRNIDLAWADVTTGLIALATTAGLLDGGATRTDVSSAARSSRNRIFHVPFSRNAHFTGRDTEMAWLDTALCGDARWPVALLAGMGGVGKTATAGEYAHRHRDEFAVVWWVEAETAEGRDAAFAALAVELALPEAMAPDMAVTRGAVVEWMNQNAGWLVVFDNAESPETLTGWMPTSPKGRTLITSRDDHWQGTALVWGVAEWDLRTATDFLLERTGSSDRAAAEALAGRLGCLPLACEQAGAYITAKRISLTRYMTLFDTNAARLLRDCVFGGHKGLTVSVELCFESLGEADGLAPSVLWVLARLGPDDIPRDLLDEWQGADALAGDDAVGALFRTALIRGDDKNLSIHRLVRELIRAADPEPRESDGTAMLLLADALGKCGNPQTAIQDWPRLAALAPHATALFDGLTGDGDDPPEPDAAGRVCSQLDSFFQYARGDVRGARVWSERALVIGERHLAADAPELAALLNNLGSVLQELGDLAGAKAHHERALAIDEKVYGADHPRVATDANNLGCVLRGIGDLAGAKAHHERALAIDEKELGSDHPNVARDANNLGLVLRDMGDLADAKAHFERALGINEKAFGPIHPRVATDANNLGLVLRELGDLAGAKAHYERALAIVEMILPPEHPNIAIVHDHLAIVEAEIRAKGGGTA